MGHPISADTVRKELVKLGFSRQSNRKAEEGARLARQTRFPAPQLGKELEALPAYVIRV